MTGCPTDQILDQFLTEKLDEDHFLQVSEHIDRCPGCQSKLESIVRDDDTSRWRVLREKTTSPHWIPSEASENVPLPEIPGYEILSILGRGGMGVVYKARQHALDRTVALKMILTGHPAGPELVQRFQREARTAAQLTHPNVVGVYDAGQTGDTHYLVMEYVEGIDLARFVNRSGRLPVEQACDFARQVALGLQAAHEHGLVHRDIKPANLLVSGVRSQESGVRSHPTGLRQTKNSESDALFNSLDSCSLTPDSCPLTPVIKILDFGLARFTSETKQRGDLTASGMALGTPDFIAPEQAEDAKSADIRADIFSLGCTLFYLLTGQPPYSGNNIMEKLAARLSSETPRVRSLRPELPEQLDDVLAMMMAREPAERFATPAEVAAALNPFCGSAAQPAFRPQKLRGRILAAALCAAAVLMGLGLIWIFDPFGTRSEYENGHAKSRKKLPPAKKGTKPSAAPEVKRKPKAKELEKKSKTVKSAPAGPELVPIAERYDWQPKELTAIFGTHRRHHWGPVTGLALSPDGELLATSGYQLGRAFVTLWDTRTNRELATAILDKPGSSVRELSFSPSGKVLAGVGGSVGLWNVDREKGLAPRESIRPGFASGLNLVTFADEDTLVVADHRMRMERWDISKKKPTLLFKTHKVLAAFSAQLSPDGRTYYYLYADAQRRTVKVRTWEAKSKEDPTLLEISRKTSFIRPTIAANCRFFFAVLDVTAHVWRIDKQPAELLGKFKMPLGEQNPGAVAFSPDGKWLALGSATGAIKLYEIQPKDLRYRGVFAGHNGQVQCLRFSKDGTQLVSGSADHTFQIWDVKKVNGSVTIPPELSAPVTSVAFSPDGNSLAAVTGGYATTSSHVKIWELDNGKEVFHRAGKWSFEEVFFTPDGHTLIAGGGKTTRGSLSDSLLIAWDLSGKKRTHTASPHSVGGSSRGVNALHISRDGKTLAFLAGDLPFGSRAVGLSYVNAFQMRGVFPCPTLWPELQPTGRGIRCIALASNGDLVAVGGGSERLIPKGEKRPLPPEAGVWVYRTEQFDGRGGKDIRKPLPPPEHLLRGHRLDVLALAFSPDQMRLLSIGRRRVNLWDLTKKQDNPTPVRQIELNQKPVPVFDCLAYSPDGTLVAAAAQDGRIILWDSATLAPRHTWRLPGPVNGIAFDPKSQRLATANANGTVYVLRVPAPAMIRAGH